MRIEAEWTVLGSLMKDHRLMDDCFLTPKDFTADDMNGTIFKVLLYAKDHIVDVPDPFDPKVLGSKWGNELERVGGPSYLMRIRESVPSTENFVFYQRIVRSNRIQEELAELGSKIARNGGGDLAELKAKMEQLEELQQGDNIGGPVHMAELLEGHEQVIAKRANSGGITGAKAASDDFTQLSKGHQEGDLEILAGRPSMGKTLYMVNDMDAVTSSGWADAVFSLEMGALEIVEQMASCIGGDQEGPDCFRANVRQ